ncbi:hypothetical protein HDV64DRAFT_251369 [Trichoderma sp. TUCIM 5745]
MFHPRFLQVFLVIVRCSIRKELAKRRVPAGIAECPRSYIRATASIPICNVHVGTPSTNAQQRGVPLDPILTGEAREENRGRRSARPNREGC